jgi:hypothetical protein
MAYHSLLRQAQLADPMKFQCPHHMTWGALGGYALVSISEACLIALLVFKIVKL